MASPNLTSDCTARPSFPLDQERSVDADVVYFEDDTSQSIQRSTTISREVKLIFENQTNAQKTSFETFWNARNGPVSIWYWTNPRDTTPGELKYRFKENKVTFNSVSPSVWNWTVTAKSVA